MVNKTDRNDARGISNIMRANLYKTVHVKTQQSQEWRMLLTSRHHLLNKLQDMDNHIRGELRNFGVKMGQVSKLKFEERVREVIEQAPRLLRLINSLLKVRQALWKE
jgi:transposase